MKIMLVTRVAAMSLVAACLGSTAYAESPAHARSLAATCANCHGTDGRSDGSLPGLAGVDKGYLAQQMKDYKTGKRPGTIMHQLAKGFTDAQIELIAGYFAALRK